ncbi:hypothetical protein C0J52_11226 [Blattella germanica]|nr:hypothetical protein C0J52_11226 [Blattella germanica]
MVTILNSSYNTEPSSKPLGGPTGTSWSELTPLEELSPSSPVVGFMTRKSFGLSRALAVRNGCAYGLELVVDICVGLKEEAEARRLWDLRTWGLAECAGKVADEFLPCRPSTSTANIYAIQESVERSPKSVHCLAHQLQIPKSSMFKVLKFTLKTHAYHLQVLYLYQLHDEDIVKRMVMCIGPNVMLVDVSTYMERCLITKHV